MQIVSKIEVLRHTVQTKVSIESFLFSRRKGVCRNIPGGGDEKSHFVPLDDLAGKSIFVRTF